LGLQSSTVEPLEPTSRN